MQNPVQYSRKVMELFQAPVHAGSIEGPARCGEAGTPGGGPYVVVWLRVEDGVVTAASFKTYGCPSAIAAGEAVCAWAEGRRLAELASVTAEQVIDWLDGVPEGKEHAPALAAAALRAAAEQKPGTAGE